VTGRTVAHQRPVTDAIILAAGNSDRFAHPHARSKLLYPVGGRPLIARTLEAAYRAGVRRAHIILGHQADRVHGACIALAPDELALSFSVNPRWQLEKGVSVLAARGVLARRRFAVLLGDHLFEPAVLAHMRALPLASGESAIAVDTRLDDPRLVAGATRVRTAHGFVVAVGRDLPDFDALAAGMLVCDDNLFDALDASCRMGDTTLSGGVRRLAGAGLVRAMPIGDARWYDIDTPADLRAAEAAGLPGDRPSRVSG
jgi:1L-myo-inositol 1-phosphate cytidylyltransferase